MQVVREHTAFFEFVVDSIPPSVYIPDVNEEAKASQYIYNKKGGVSKKAVRNRASLDPHGNHSVTQLQRQDNPSTGMPLPIHGEGGSIEELRDRLREKIASIAPKMKTKERKVEVKKKAGAKKSVVKKVDVPVDVVDQKVKVDEKPQAAETLKEDIGFGRMVVDTDETLLHKKQGLKVSRKKKSNKELLRIAENVEKRIAGLEGEKKEKAIKKQAFKNAMMKAEGKKVKDDKKMLQKTVQKEEKQKQKSKLKWDERLSAQKKSKKEANKEKDKKKLKTVDRK